MVNDPASGNVWREAAREELRQVIDDLLHTEKTHMAAAERLGKIHRRLGLIATALATLGGATILAPTRASSPPAYSPSAPPSRPASSPS